MVYPDELAQDEWLPWYARHLTTVELNTTFYRLPEATTVSRWAAAVPAGFSFAVKLGSFGSHRKKLRDAESWLPRHVERVSRLGTALGPTLVQLPPRWRRNVGRLDEFLGTVPPAMRCAVELRDPSWLHDDIYDVLRRHDAALCIHDLLEDHPRICTARWTYVRFHGPDARARPYHGRYGRRRLRPWADWLGEVVDDGADAFAYFNNDHEGHAFSDAVQLREMLGAAG